MRLRFYTVAVPVLASFAWAQETPPAQPKQEQPPASAPSSTAGNPSDRPMVEMKTMTYSGTLVDASCAGSSAPAATSSADRSAASAGSGEACPISSNTTAFGIKTKEGTTFRFDDVGNARVQEAMKNKKSWRESAAGNNKPIKIKARGVVSNEKLIVLSID